VDDGRFDCVYCGVLLGYIILILLVYVFVYLCIVLSGRAIICVNLLGFIILFNKISPN